MDEIELESNLNGVAYRLAERRDIVDMLAIERDVYEGEVPWTFSHFEHEIVQNKDAFFVVAEIDNKVVGFIGARLTDKGVNIHISNLAVLRDYQKRGIATTLINQIVRLMSNLGKNQMTLEVRRDNTKAQGLYRRNGFETDNLMPNYYEDGADAIWMVKKLRNNVEN
ncbi:alanine acetyltransferase [Lactococcus fujiensis JCM 16395]|uniref:Alanine acetyltransferase n=2 Tax=Lactococcus fujiensis TaxID=610251 RepID=A0A2A5RKU6_9LACT|nr:alanine acetyltransferase [Lactococcus fujiensis JCM 16395]